MNLNGPLRKIFLLIKYCKLTKHSDPVNLIQYITRYSDNNKSSEKFIKQNEKFIQKNSSDT